MPFKNIINAYFRYHKFSLVNGVTNSTFFKTIVFIMLLIILSTTSFLEMEFIIVETLINYLSLFQFVIYYTCRCFTVELCIALDSYSFKMFDRTCNIDICCFDTPLCDFLSIKEDEEQMIFSFLLIRGFVPLLQLPQEKSYKNNNAAYRRH